MQSLLEKNFLDRNDKRQNLITLLCKYSDFIQKKKDAFYKNQMSLIEQMLEFVLKTPNCFERESNEGHVTGSAFIMNAEFTHCLLTQHRKLKKWIQLGGHSDGHPLVHEVSLKEAKEESGLNDFEFLDIRNFPKTVIMEKALPFDIDIHLIPKTLKENEHFHYDIRFLLKASQNEKIAISSESLDLKWIPLEDIKNYTKEGSSLRQVKKVQALLDEL